MKYAARWPVRSLAVAALAATLSGAFMSPSATAQTVMIPAEKPQPALVKLLPPGAAGRPFVLAVALGSPPDDFRDAKNEVVGWEIDIVRAATQALGLELQIRPTTFDTLIPGLQARRFDGATGQLGVTVVREKVVDMIGYLYGNELFAALADSPIQVHTLDDLCGRTVATTRGSREMVFASQQNPKCVAAGKKPINALAFDSGNGAAEALMSRRADLYWVGSTAISYFVAQSNGRTKVVGHYTDLSFIGIALPKGSPLVKPMQAAIQHLIDDGTYLKIVTKWGLQNNVTKTAELNPTQAKE
jgi:polar amino acid transport system substrate-binding protein